MLLAIIEWFMYYATRPLCWLGFHTIGCRGLQDHLPLTGWWYCSVMGWHKP